MSDRSSQIDILGGLLALASQRQASASSLTGSAAQRCVAPPQSISGIRPRCKWHRIASSHGLAVSKANCSSSRFWEARNTLRS
eukprot:8541025-Lingulodinium_polyedra.AAC.1